MAWFGIIAYFWVKNEIGWSKVHAPSRVLAWAGLWSYSLYLVHAQTADLWYLLNIQNVGPRLFWCGVILSSLIGAYAFYLVVEWPSHRLARWIGTSRSGTASATAESEGSNIGTSASVVSATIV
jgi:peptidoglycan/LPS O-acetylase OafA/YrhL